MGCHFVVHTKVSSVIRRQWSSLDVCVLGQTNMHIQYTLNHPSTDETWFVFNVDVIETLHALPHPVPL